MNTAKDLKIWNKGAEYCRNGSAFIEEITDYKDLKILKGKVNCSFGYVHRPIVAVSEDEGAVKAAECDCYEVTEKQPFCSHCAAVVRSAYGERIRKIEIDLSVDLRAITGSRAENNDRVDLLKFTDDGFSKKAEGLAHCNFGYTHRPRVTVEDGKPVEYYCDCYLAADSDKMCSHCRTLYAMMMAEENGAPEDTATENESSAPAEEKLESNLPAIQGTEEIADIETVQVEEIEPAGAEELFPIEEELEKAPEPEPEIILHEPESMEILFGTEIETGENICWYPNDTNRIFHTNTGIIGTMGTGKTQFTKSLIAQMYWERSHNYTGTPLGFLIFDYKGDYNETKPDFVDAVSAKVIKPHRMPFNPFSLSDMKAKPLLPLHVASTFAAIIEKIYHLGPKQVTQLRHCIVDAYKRRDIIASNPETWNKPAPTFEDVYEIYCENEEIKKNDSLFSAMDTLHEYEIFESDSSKTGSLYGILNGVISVDISGYDTETQHLVVAIMLELFYSQMQNSGSSQMSGNLRQLTKFLLVDEADNFMSQGFRVLKKIMKEGREFGVGTILSTQSLEHFSSTDENYDSMIMTWVVHQVPNLKRPELEVIFNIERSGDSTEKLLQQIRSLGKSRSIVKIGTREPVCIQDKPFWQLLEER